jgi:hypothetical protein
MHHSVVFRNVIQISMFQIFGFPWFSIFITCYYQYEEFADRPCTKSFAGSCHHGERSNF